MAIDKKRPHDSYSVNFGLNEYFHSNVLPVSLNFMNKSISGPTPRVQNENNLLLLVRRGTGSMVINHQEVRLRRGVCMCLGPFHNYAISPDRGSTIEIAQSQINSGAYLYILSCPYVKVSEFLVPREPAIAKLSEKYTREAEAIFDSLSQSGKPGYYEDKLGFLGFMQLFGILLHALESAPPKNNPYRHRRSQAEPAGQK